MSKSAMEVARKALDLALKVERNQEAYEDINTERYSTITARLEAVTTKIDNATRSIIGLLLTVVGLMAYELLIR